MSEKINNNTNFMNGFKKIFAEIKTDLKSACPDSESLYRYYQGDLNQKMTSAYAAHLDMCPVCLEIVHKLGQADQISDEEIARTENWSKIEKELDSKIYSYIPSSKSQNKNVVENKKSYSDFLSKLIAKLKDYIPEFPKAPGFVYAGATVLLCVVSLYAFAFLNRPLYFNLAQIDTGTNEVLRSSVTSSTEFQNGLQFYYQKKYDQAIEQFNIFITENRDHYQGNYYLGLCYLFIAEKNLLGLAYKFDQENINKGIEYIKRAQNLSLDNLYYQEDCFWFLGKAGLMSGNRDLAKDYFNKIVLLDQPNLARKKMAENMLLELKKE